MIAETYTSLVDDKPRRNARIGGAVRHEVGHVMSYILNNMSEDRLFQKAHAHDVGNLAVRRDLQLLVRQAGGGVELLVQEAVEGLSAR